MSIDRAIDRSWPVVGRPDWKVSVTRDRTDAARPAAPALDEETSTDDRTLVDACRGGRRDAFDVIGNHEDASDLAQDVFIRAYRGLHTFKGNSAFSTWLYRVCVNVCLNRVGSRTPRLAALDIADRPDPRVEHPDTSLLRGERAAEVRAAIARLPAKQRAALILRVYHELPHEAIAEIVGSSVGAVKANFFHALANLRKLLRPRS